MMSAKKSQTKNNQQKVFDRLAIRFKNKISESVSEEEQPEVDKFLKRTFINSALRSTSDYNNWLFSSTVENYRCYAWDNDKVVGSQYGLTGKVGHAENEVDVCCAIDLSVDKKWRMKGLGVALIKKLMDSNDLVIGLGISQAAQAMFTRLDWQNMGQVSFYIKPLKAKGFSSTKQGSGLRSSIIYPVLARGVRFFTRLKHTLSANPDITNLSNTPNYQQALDTLFSKNSYEGFFALQKNSGYFEWRYLKAPTSTPYDIFFLHRNKQVSSYLVTITSVWQGKKVLAICDYIGPATDYPALIRLAEKQALNEGVDAIMYQGINPEFEKALKRSLFIKRPHGDLFMLHSKDNNASLSEVRNVDKWRITFSDSDMDFMFFQS